MSRIENNDLTPPAGYTDASMQLLQSSTLLFLRAAVILGQNVAKRVILSRKNQALLNVFGDIAALEDFIFISTFSPLCYITTRVAQTAGEVPFDPKKIGIVYRTGLLFSAGLAIITGMLCLTAPLIYRTAKQPASVINSSGSYFRIAFFGYLFDLIRLTEVRMLVGLSRLTPPLVVETAECALDVFLTYVFVMKLNMGLNGSALAYTMSSAIALVSCTLYLLLKSDFWQYELFRFSKGVAECQKLVSKGLHIGCSATVEYAAQFLVTFYYGLSGTTALLGMQAASVCSLAISQPIYAISEAGSVKTANYFERKNPAYHLLGNTTLAFSVAYALFCGATINYFINSFASLFINQDNFSTEYFQIVVSFIRIQTGIELLNSVKTASASVLAACNETGFSFSVSVAFIFFLNSLLATLSQFAFKQGPVPTYTTQLTGFMLSAMAVGAAWHQHAKEPRNPFARGFQKVNAYLNALWEKAPTMQLESPRHLELTSAV
ncbi:MAG: hypothetical protein A3F13_07315 [Gammaproteobacteria bacterium RIFCSPHIGHO2_12_FULL_40_19]|nr:MAG: hypothetical protein A3F13_07315 [Gammaproteobacteria bacterium RIFCSPHIGHO2_12_FULL_40_19]